MFLALVFAVLFAFGGNAFLFAGTHIPDAPRYENPQLWIVKNESDISAKADVFYIVSTWEADWICGNGDLCFYADVYNLKHRGNMAIEINKVAEYMADGNRFFSPFYRHMSINSWATRDENLINERVALSMNDIKAAFDYYLANQNQGRPFVLAGFSQGGRAVVELLKYMDDKTYQRLVAAYVLGYKVTPQDVAECHRIVPAQNASDTGVTICYNTVKDVKYIAPIVAAPCAMCINPVNWKTDATPAKLNAAITITKNTEHNVLVATGYPATEYKPILGFLNVGDIHSCEPWLYRDCLKENIRHRVKCWHEKQ